jgi:pyridoxal phosphate enzyme (YggS family)
MTPSIPENLEKVRFRITQFEHAYARSGSPVRLIAVSKTHPPEKIREAWDAGQTWFGENYLQEAIAKQQALSDLAITWHFIGPIQSDKTHALAEHFHWVHSVDRLKIARRLEEQRPPALPPLNILLQVNISNESTKSGVHVNALEALADGLREYPRLALCGLMAIPEPSDDFEVQRQRFRQLREARDNLLARGHDQCQHLSMGMSSDFEAAIAEGATMIRIGTEIFGPRQ